MTAAHPSDLEAALAPALAAMEAVTDADRRASAREALGRKCPRFVPNPAPILPFLMADAQLRQIIEGLPASVEALTADGGVSYEFRKARALEASVSVASKNDRVAA